MGTMSPGASQWASDTLTAILDGIRDGSIMCCPHVPDRPPEVHALNLKYERVSCPDCAHTMFADLAEVGATCDQCGSTNRELREARARINGDWLRYAQCEACFQAEHALLEGGQQA